MRGIQEMFDTDGALADMADQIRICRNDDGLTLQQLATRSGVAASTIHKVESRQMVPTVAVLLKIAKGLGCRPQQLIRDQAQSDAADVPGVLSEEVLSSPVANFEELPPGADGSNTGTPPPASRITQQIGVWRIEVGTDTPLRPIDLDEGQRATFLVEEGTVNLETRGQCFPLGKGDCIEILGGQVVVTTEAEQPASLTLIASPRGQLERLLGKPRSAAPRGPADLQAAKASLPPLPTGVIPGPR